MTKANKTLLHKKTHSRQKPAEEPTAMRLTSYILPVHFQYNYVTAQDSPKSQQA